MIAGMDAVITFTKNPDGPSSLRDTNVLDMLGKIFTEHRKQPAVVWRICFASAMFSPDFWFGNCSNKLPRTSRCEFRSLQGPKPPLDAIYYSILGILGDLGLGSSLMLRIRVFVTN